MFGLNSSTKVDGVLALIRKNVELESSIAQLRSELVDAGESVIEEQQQRAELTTALRDCQQVHFAFSKCLSCVIRRYGLPCCYCNAGVSGQSKCSTRIERHRGAIDRRRMCVPIEAFAMYVDLMTLCSCCIVKLKRAIVTLKRLSASADSERKELEQLVSEQRSVISKLRKDNSALRATTSYSAPVDGSSRAMNWLMPQGLPPVAGKQSSVTSLLFNFLAVAKLLASSPPIMTCSGYTWPTNSQGQYLETPHRSLHVTNPMSVSMPTVSGKQEMYYPLPPGTTPALPRANAPVEGTQSYNPCDHYTTISAENRLEHDTRVSSGNSCEVSQKSSGAMPMSAVISGGSVDRYSRGDIGRPTNAAQRQQDHEEGDRADRKKHMDREGHGAPPGDFVKRAGVPLEERGRLESDAYERNEQDRRCMELVKQDRDVREPGLCDLDNDKLVIEDTENKELNVQNGLQRERERLENEKREQQRRDQEAQERLQREREAEAERERAEEVNKKAQEAAEAKRREEQDAKAIQDARARVLARRQMQKKRQEGEVDTGQQEPVRSVVTASATATPLATASIEPIETVDDSVSSIGMCVIEQPLRYYFHIFPARIIHVLVISWRWKCEHSMRVAGAAAISSGRSLLTQQQIFVITSNVI